ncbi:Homeodomain ZF-HD class domain-containing protein [Dioscorea alata]|uniref:Homeodomain ZF-HD class domain-containing protein n=1 Tax=Dioscorea alata TaxID=55571 RepID=A0ACB7U8C8_DIOAL|nr:Homeodomain ZF-HD class domain-containing protein [Dioscorea alata]
MEMFKECMRNHAANLGTYAADGCLEYTADESRPGGYRCAACGCHRNFHRKIMMDNINEGAAYSLPAAEDRTEGQRRPRTKFSSEQKVRMAKFAEKIGWRLQKRDSDEGDEIMKFCKEIGVSRQVFKVWMHNHKNSSASSSTNNSNVAASSSKNMDHCDAMESPLSETK